MSLQKRNKSRSKTKGKKRKIQRKSIKRNRVSKSNRQLAFLTVLGNTKNKKRRNLLIEYAGKEDIDAICQCVYNVLKGNIKLSPRSFAKLKKHKKILRLLVNRRVNNKKRKAVLKQKGGFLSMLIPLAVSLLGGLAGGT